MMHRAVSNESDTPRIGVALSAGGIRGVYAHTGFMQAMQSLKIPVFASAGCSACALVGGFIGSAREQTESLLQPYMDAILNDPRERLPVTGNSAMNPTHRCGNSDTL